jgi:segregation and condensation protein B
MTERIDVVEALLFASDAPVEAERIQEVLELGSPEDARALVDALRERLGGEGRALQVIEAGGGFRLVTRPEVAPWLVRLARSRTRSRLSRPALETLAIVAYRQPVSRPEVDAIRGVNSEGVLDNLLERRMIRISGRKDSPGRPFLYETTREFLIAFGLRGLEDLPAPEGELLVPAAAATEPQTSLPLEPSAAAGGGEEAAGPPDEESAPDADPADQDPGPGGAHVTTGR